MKIVDTKKVINLARLHFLMGNASIKMMEDNKNFDRNEVSSEDKKIKKKLAIENLKNAMNFFQEAYNISKNNLG